MVYGGGRFAMSTFAYQFTPFTLNHFILFSSISRSFTFITFRRSNADNETEADNVWCRQTNAEHFYHSQYWSSTQAQK